MPEEMRSRREPLTTSRARSLRRGDNIAEGRLWNELKDRRLNGFKFVRQFPIGPYFADFLCRQKRLVVEIDGSQHQGSDYDRRRDEFMQQEGFSVLRFWNEDVLTQLDQVLETIVAALDGRLRNDIVASDLRVVIGRKNVKSDS